MLPKVHKMMPGTDNAKYLKNSAPCSKTRAKMGSVVSVLVQVPLISAAKSTGHTLRKTLSYSISNHSNNSNKIITRYDLIRAAEEEEEEEYIRKLRGQRKSK